jgi:hypothetical protein
MFLGVNGGNVPPGFPSNSLWEVNMQHCPTLTTHPPETKNRPHLLSLDCAEECSVEHWVEINWRVEIDEEDLKGYLLEDSCFVSSR